MNEMIKGMVRSSGCGVAIFSILLFAEGCGKPSRVTGVSEWKSFSPPGGNFTVTMPPNPVEERPKTETGFESRTYRILSAMSNLAGLAVSYSDQPNTASFEKNPAKILDAVRTKSVEDLGGQLIREQSITLGSYPGREFWASVKGGFTVRQRIFLVNKRMYSQMVIAGSKGLDSLEARTFFDSFRILQ